MDCVLHDYFAVPEGGGRLSLILARGLRARLACGFIAPGHPFFQEYETLSGIMELLGKEPARMVRSMVLARSFVRKTGFLEDNERAYYSGAYAPLAILGNRAGRNILYCHTPPRFLYDLKEHFARRLPLALRPLFSLLRLYLKPRYEAAVRAMDVVTANSRTVQDRVKRHLGVESRVIHPPCETEKYYWRSPEGYFLSTARLDSLKRVHTIIEAFKAMGDRRLVVLSTGPDAPRLHQLARGADNIRFTGAVSESEYRDLLSRCIATIQIPFDEDFGMAAVESMAAGKPVIGVNQGGTAETVVHGETGLLLAPEPTPESLALAVRDLGPSTAKAMRGPCRARARRFSAEAFLTAMRSL